jgi:hypothetical protein
MNRLLNNWTLKLMALIIAIALWGHVRGEVNPLETATFTVKPSLDAPPGWAFQNVSALPRTVQVTLRAPRNTLRELKGGVSVNPLAPTDEAPPLGASYLTARLEIPVLKDGPTTATVRVESGVEDAEVIGVKPADATVSLIKNAG